ncbi:MAG: thioredoxin family protein [Firmicutes bacterium]|nr:thioredoxin family protein [Bacillota bacterium]
MKTAWKVVLLVILVLIAAGLYFGRGFSGPKNPDGNFIEPGQTGRPMVLDLGSTGCVPCQMMAPVLKDLAKEYQNKVDIQIVDIYERNDLAERYRIYAIPTQIFFDQKGKEVYRHEGFLAKETIVQQLKDLNLYP